MAITFDVSYFRQGDNVKQGLLSLVNELPELFDQISKKTCELEDAVAYYEAFVGFVVPK